MQIREVKDLLKYIQNSLLDTKHILLALGSIPDRPYKDEMIRQVEEMGAEEVVMNDEV